VLELQSELQQTETKLTELQSKRNDQTSLMMTPEQDQELKRFTAEKTRVRKELRETQRGLDVDINRLDDWLKVINIAVAPLLVAIAGRAHPLVPAQAQEPGRQPSMSRARFTLLLVAALVAICGAFYLSSQRNLQSDTPAAPPSSRRSPPSSIPSPRSASSREARRRRSRCTRPASSGRSRSARTIRRMWRNSADSC
jgi:hypothetical protein